MGDRDGQAVEQLIYGRTSICERKLWAARAYIHFDGPEIPVAVGAEVKKYRFGTSVMFPDGKRAISKFEAVLRHKGQHLFERGIHRLPLIRHDGADAEYAALRVHAEAHDLAGGALAVNHGLFAGESRFDLPDLIRIRRHVGPPYLLARHLGTFHYDFVTSEQGR